VQAHLLSIYVQMSNNMHASLQADAFNPAPQYDGAAPAPAAPTAPSPAAPAPVSLADPADAGDITGGPVVPARQQKQKVHHLLFASSITHFCKVPAAFTVLVLVMSSSKRQTAACLIKLLANVWLFINHLVQGVLACFPLPL